MDSKLYSVHNLLQAEGSLQCNVTYHPEHPVFSGHFPGQPVVPGVCTMAMIKDLLQQATGKKLLLRSTGQVKFLRLILPGAHPEVMISWSAGGEGYQFTAGLKENGQDLFKMQGLFEEITSGKS